MKSRSSHDEALKAQPTDAPLRQTAFRSHSRAVFWGILALIVPSHGYGAPAGLVAGYTFDENSGAVAGDVSGNGNQGAISGPTWTTGKYGSALRFNGTNALVTIADSASLDVTNKFTIEAWVNPSASSAWRTVVMKEAPSGLAYALYSHNSGNRPAAYVRIGTSDTSLNGSAALALNTWSHLAMTYDGASIRLYINGVLRGTRSAAGSAAVSTGPLTIGGNAVWGEYFAGSIDEARLYNRVLTAAEITSDMNTPLTPAGPAISITSPAGGASVSGTINLSATASSPAGIAGVQFKLDGSNLGTEVTSSPYQISWNSTAVADGAHTFTAVAREGTGGTVTSAPVSVTIANTTPPTLPTISITAPASGATVSGSITISANAQNATGVQFMVDGVNVETEDTSQPYSVSWNSAAVSDGSHNVTAKARNAAGSTTSAAVTVTVSNASSPSITGSWSPLIDMPIVPVHAALLHTGKVLIFDRPSAGPTARVWDIASNTFTSVPNNTTDLFCAGHSAMADGRILVVGGHGSSEAGTADVNIFDPVSLSWTLVSRMAYKRWYPTATTLPDGRVLATTGAASTVTDYVTIPEVYNPSNNTWTRLTGASADLAQYGHMFLLPNGKVAYTGNWEFPGDARVLDVSTQTWTTVDPNITDGYSVMYQPGKILKCGSSSDSGLSGASGKACNLIDFTASSPRWQPATPMAFPRTHHNFTLLPDGNVLVSGGSTMKEGYVVANAVRYPEMWSPVTQTWTTMAQQAKPRLYHSEALLLPDGRVLSMGGGRDGSGVDQLNAEIYSPPYLFKGARPAIAAAPSVITYADTFSVSTPDAAGITSVVLMRLGSPTHGFDMDQRTIALNFQASVGALTVQAPTNANLAPPGYYMLFLVNSAGVPSVASFVRVPLASQSTPPTAPGVLTASGGIGTVTLGWQASTSASGISNYNVHRSTTPGFTPSATNRIAQPVSTSYIDTGLPAQRYYYVVTAEDTNHLVSTPSNEAPADVTGDTIPPSITITAPTTATVSGTVSVQATATDDVGIVGVQFLLDGVNLGAEVAMPPYSVSWSTLTATNGAHTLTARVKDVGGNATTSAPLSITVANTQPSGLVAAYSFSEGSGSSTVDRSGNGNNGAITGATWSSGGKFGNALSFTGSARVTVADSASLDLTTGMTLMAWISPTANTNWRTVILKQTSNDLAYALYANSDSNQPGVWITAGSTQFVKGTAQIPSSSWAHLAATYDGGTLRMFVNGVQVSSVPGAQPIVVSSGPLQIGGNTIWGEYFSGLIDDVRVYNRALTAAEITNAMNTAVAQ
jgi:hypothetical protein